MRKFLLMSCCLFALAGCELMEDMAYSERKTWIGSENFGDGVIFESYQIDIYNNFDGTKAGIGYEFVVENGGYQDLCVRLDFSTLSGATAYHYNYLQRIAPGGSAVVGSASRYQAGRLNVQPAPEWAFIEAWQTCDAIEWR